MDTLPFSLVALPERCYRCGRLTRGVVGVLVSVGAGDPLTFREFDEVASTLAGALSPAQLRPLAIGTIKPRHSRQRGTYLSNGCVHCDAILGSFPLREALSEFLAEGGVLTDLVVGDWQPERDVGGRLGQPL